MAAVCLVVSFGRIGYNFPLFLSLVFIPGRFGALSPWLGVPYLLHADPHLQASVEEEKN